MPIAREWFNRILRGTKKVEYRADGDYWKARLQRGPVSSLKLINGRTASSPWLRVAVLSISTMSTKALGDDAPAEGSREHGEMFKGAPTVIACRLGPVLATSPGLAASVATAAEQATTAAPAIGPAAPATPAAAEASAAATGGLRRSLTPTEPECSPTHSDSTSATTSKVKFAQRLLSGYGFTTPRRGLSTDSTQSYGTSDLAATSEEKARQQGPEAEPATPAAARTRASPEHSQLPWPELLG